MAKKQLVVNMIYGGSFHRADTVLEEEEIPPNLRKPEYLKEPERKRRKQEELDEIETEDLNFSDDELEAEVEAEEEEEQKPRAFRIRKKR
jgi:hypothetical protein